MQTKLILDDIHIVDLVFGGRIQVHLQCHQIVETKGDFVTDYIFGFIAYDVLITERRVLLDQHRGKPCHLHIGAHILHLNVMPQTVEEALDIFWTEVKKYFGEFVRSE